MAKYGTTLRSGCSKTMPERLGALSVSVNYNGIFVQDTFKDAKTAIRYANSVVRSTSGPRLDIKTQKHGQDKHGQYYARIEGRNCITGRLSLLIVIRNIK